ncbi:PREDICTED: uncharacterized protein LOC104825520 [Tarenaya hassleriana]|uniref:uncharacterized protein LOC104825520 n=1 Tax=Tarenaya hassleriana TaxID=28532 RepID=UPI00053C8E4D|nr:PREDICTED: uncharacterized protein LOC104825520 [Tarenaya hassleriana]
MLFCRSSSIGFTFCFSEEKLSVPGSASVELKHDLQLNEAESSAPEQDIPVASTYRNLVDESRDLSELMKAEEEEQLEHAGGEDKANVIEDPSEQLNSSSELGIQMQTVTAEQTGIVSDHILKNPTGKRENNHSASVVFSQSMEQSPVVDEAILKDTQRAIDFIVQEDYINALAITEKSISNHGKACGFLPHFLQGIIFSVLSGKARNADVKCTYWLSATESFSRSDGLLPGSLLLIHFHASSLFKLGELLNAKVYYDRAEDKAREGLSQEILDHQTIPQEIVQILKEDLEFLIKLVETKKKPDDSVDFDIKERVEKNEPISGLTAEIENRAEISSFWAGMSDERKQDLLRVDTMKLKRYVEGKYSGQRSEALEKALTFAKTNLKWKFWRCGTCSMVFHSSEECRKHLEYKHVEHFTPPEDIIPQIVDGDCCEMIQSGNWEPMTTVMTIDIDSILSPNYEENRRNILKEFGELLKSVSKRKMLSRGLWDLLKEMTVCSLQESGVPKEYLSYTGLDKIPRCFCLLQLDPLRQMLACLRHLTVSIRTERVFRAVDGIRENSRVTQHIISDYELSCLILDNDAKISQGDEIISWILERTRTDEEEELMFKRPVMVHNLGIWLAVLRNLEWECKALETTYQRKLNVQFYSRGLEEVQRSLNQWRAHPQGWVEETYRFLLRKVCWSRVEKGGIPSSNDTIGYLSVVRDVVEEARSPRFEVLQVEEYLNHISNAYVDDDSVLESFSVLKEAFSDKIRVLDSELLLHENAKHRLLDDLTDLSMFDYRSVILPLLKSFLREELEKMIETDTKQKAVAAEAEKEDSN